MCKGDSQDDLQNIVSIIVQQHVDHQGEEGDPHANCPPQERHQQMHRQKRVCSKGHQVLEYHEEAAESQLVQENHRTNP